MKNSEQGFSLIEVLIAISLLAVIFSFLTGALHFGHKAWDFSNNLTKSSPVGTARSFLINRISSIHPLRVSQQGRSAELVFRGESNQLEFIASMPERVIKAGFYKVQLRFVNNDLKIYMQPYHPLQNYNNQMQVRSLVSGVKKLSFSYFGMSDRNASPTWHAQWQRKDILPSLVRVDLELGEKKRWWPVVVELKVE